jgi:hypothetical protein
VKQKENIFEELNKMRNLIHTKAGTVISEQPNDINTDIQTVKREMSMGFMNNSDEQKTVDVLKKYATNKSTFQNFLNQYKTTTGVALTDELPKQFQSGRDQGEIRDLNSVLSKLGVTFEVGLNPEKTKFVASFKGLDGAAPTAVDTSKVEEMWKGSKVSCVTTQPGIRQSKMKNGSTVYVLDKVVYYANGRKKLADGTMANYNCSTEFKSRATSNAGGRANVVSGYSKELQTSLGVTPTGQLSDADLDLILKRLEGGETGGATPSLDTQSIPMDANGQPDIDKIIASL